FEIAYPGLERDAADVAVGEAAAARIVAQHLVLARERIEPRAPGEALPLMLKMRNPGRRHHERRAVAADGIGEARLVRGRAEPDVLVPCGIASARLRHARHSVFIHPSSATAPWPSARMRNGSMAAASTRGAVMSAKDDIATSACASASRSPNGRPRWPRMRARPFTSS